MLNFEKYKEKIENCNVVNENVDCFLCRLRKVNCDSYSCCSQCLKESLKFLFSEYKGNIKLTQFEFDFFKNIDKEYKWIVRGKNDMLYLFENKPFKGNVGFWYCSEESSGKDLYFFDHLFQFIKWEDEEPQNIQELLENCEVIEDD